MCTVVCAGGRLWEMLSTGPMLNNLGFWVEALDTHANGSSVLNKVPVPFFGKRGTVVHWADLMPANSESSLFDRLSFCACSPLNSSTCAESDMISQTVPPVVRKAQLTIMRPASRSRGPVRNDSTLLDPLQTWLHIAGQTVCMLRS